MALSRKMLAAMDIPAEKIDEIITAHTETLNALKEERDSLKSEIDGLKTAKSDLEKANAEIEKFKSGDWEAKYNKIKGEYDTYKTETETKATKAAKETAYKQLLKDAGISDKRIPAILKVSDVDAVKLNKEGKIEDADKLTESVKTEWADFIVEKGEQGATTPNPPANDGSSKPKSRAAELAAQYHNEHYGSSKED